MHGKKSGPLRERTCSVNLRYGLEERLSDKDPRDSWLSTPYSGRLWNPAVRVWDKYRNFSNDERLSGANERGKSTPWISGRVDLRRPRRIRVQPRVGPHFRMSVRPTNYCWRGLRPLTTARHIGVRLPTVLTVLTAFQVSVGIIISVWTLCYFLFCFCAQCWCIWRNLRQFYGSCRLLRIKCIVKVSVFIRPF